MNPGNHAGADGEIQSGAKRVLIVDDSEDMRFMARLLFNATPLVEIVGEASNGPEAIRMAEELKPDLILMDVLMPGMSGIEATESIKKSMPETTIIGYTAWMAATIQQMIQAGASAVFRKDRVEELVQHLREWATVPAGV